MRRGALLALLMCLGWGTSAAGQEVLELGELQQAALAHDPRAAQAVLHEREHDLRSGNLRAERLPELMIRGEAVHQSDVTTLGIEIPNVEVPQPPRNRYQVALEARQLVYDGGVVARQETAEEARHAEAAAELEAALYPLRTEVSTAFFQALLLQERINEVDLLTTDLSGRLARLRSEVAAGTALPGDTAAIEAERLRSAQTRDELAADLEAALAVLSDLVGRTVTAEDTLRLPDLAAAMSRARSGGGVDSMLVRPELLRFARSRERLAAEAEVVSARARPNVSAFGQAGIGRPGPFQLLDDKVNRFWSIGMRLQWQPWSWGTTDRDRELLRVQAEVIETEADAFAARIRRQTESDARTISRLESGIEVDERIIALREQVEQQAARQFEERVIDAAQYLDARTDVLEARVARQTHLVELAQARARYLTTLGITDW